MEPHMRAPWLALIGVLSAICAALACRVIPGIPDILPAISGIFLALITFLGCSMSAKPRKVTIIATLSLTAGGVWATCAARSGVSPLNLAILAMGAAAALIIGMSEQRAADAKVEAAAMQEAAEMAAASEPARDPREAAIECLLRRITKRKDLIVRKIVPWDDPENGMDIHVDLPENFTPRDLADHTDRIQSSPTLRLPQGCVVTVIDGAYQCEAILSIMLRDCLKDHLMLEESVEPASINDKFDLMRSPQGHWFQICLRIACMIVGGTTGSGKTTLLNRIIAYLARCTDALIWVVDFNGGGLGAPWTRLYEEGKVDKPTIDWLADNETEAAVLMACAHNTATSRKTDRGAVALRRAAGSNILPVSAEKPAIIVITDEGGEVRQATSILGQIVCDRISRLAQIGRAEAVRVIMSVLRGTADLLDKALRAVCAIRVCLRMDEEGEADHVLGRNPGRTHLLHTGSAWLYRTTEDHRPIIGRSVDVTPMAIEQHSAATAHLRPTLDRAAQAVCRSISLTDVLDGRDPETFPDLLDRAPLVDVARGMAYTNRWQRRKDRLAAIERGEDPDATSTSTTKPGKRQQQRPVSNSNSLLSGGVAKLTGRCQLAGSAAQPVQPAVSDVDTEFAELTDGQHFMEEGSNPYDQSGTADQDITVRPQEEVPQASAMTLREHLKILLSEQYPNGQRAGQLEKTLTERGVSYSRKNLYVQLGAMVEKSEAEKNGELYYSPPLA